MLKICLRRQKLFKKLLAAFILFFISNAAFAIEENTDYLKFFGDFNDENLIMYINKTYENNHELKKAAASVEQYRQRVKTSFGKELPSISVGANYLGLKTPEIYGDEIKENAFVLPFIVNYEADLLLKNRDKTKAIKKEYEAAQYEKNALYIALLSDSATVYTNILQYDKLIENQEEILKNEEELFSYAKQKFESGTTGLSELNNTEKNYKNEKNKLENLIKQRDNLLLELALLLGDGNFEINNFKRGDIEEFDYIKKFPIEVKSDVIFKRPDVMAAEAKLEAAKIDIKVARKEFLPSFDITGIWTFNTLASGTFFSWESSLAALLAGATQDIFKGGIKKANLKMKKAKYEELFEFAKDIKNNRGEVLIIADGRQTNSASIASGYASSIISGYGGELSKNKGASINVEVRNRYNPNLEYKWFILTVIVAMLSLVTTLILTSLSISRERELGTFDQLIVSPLSSFEILIGKSIPPLVIAMILTLIMTLAVVIFFKLPFVGSLILFLVSIFISLLAITGVGLFISSVCNTQQQAIISVMIFMMPAVLLSGFISPIEDMPLFLQYLTYLNPVRFFMVLSKGIILKGMGLDAVIQNLIPLIIIATLTLTLAARTFKRKLG